jgi:hypothetical protein
MGCVRFSKNNFIVISKLIQSAYVMMKSFYFLFLIGHTHLSHHISDKKTSIMPCPYAQLFFDDTKNIKDNEDSDASLVDELPIKATTVNDVGDHQPMINEPVNYATYLRTDVLLSAQKCLSHTDPLDSNSLPVHDEHFFILIHQGNCKNKVLY